MVAVYQNSPVYGFSISVFLVTKTMVLIQSRLVNIKIAGGGEPGLVIMLFISFNEKITNVSGNS